MGTIDIKALTISSFNHNGFNMDRLLKINYILDKSDILLIQEQWLFSDNLDIYKSVMANCEIHGTSGMDTNKLLTGGPFDRTDILWKANLIASVTLINTPSPRISDISITIGLQHLLVLNVYIPSGFITSYRDDFLYCISLVSSYCDSREYDAVILRGDFNTNFARGAPLN